MSVVNLIYIGDKFYGESSTAMSPLYTVEGDRYDYGFMQIALARGDEINIRQANKKEMKKYEGTLKLIKRRGQLYADMRLEEKKIDDEDRILNPEKYEGDEK